jgi:hypothetical protein
MCICDSELVFSIFTNSQILSLHKNQPSFKTGIYKTTYLILQYFVLFWGCVQSIHCLANRNIAKSFLPFTDSTQAYESILFFM